MKKALSFILLFSIFLKCFFGTTVLAVDSLDENYCPKTSDGTHVASVFLSASKVDDCTQPRYYTTTCKACKEIFWAEFDSSNALAPGYHHNDGERVESIDCEKGVTKYTACKKCVLHISEKEIGPSEHNWETISYASDNCTDGVTIYKKCTVCSKETNEYLSEQEHFLTVVEADDNIYPTCTESGKLHYKCDICGYEVFQTAPSSHTWGEWVIDESETCTSSGIKHRICEKCGISETDTIAPLGHDFYDDFLECWEEFCLSCGVLVSEINCSHNNTKQCRYEPTCTKDGYDCIQCSYCGSVLQKTKEYPATRHNFSDNVCSKCNKKEFSYSSVDSGITIRGYNGDNTEVEIPSVIDGYPVVDITWYAFEGNENITSITIPDSIKNINSITFRNCINLRSVTISNGVTSIGDSAFKGCTNLVSITIPDSVISIGSDAFYNCHSLEKVYITDIEKWCNINFSNFWSNPLDRRADLYLNGVLLSELVIPEGIDNLGNAFAGCTSLTSVTIPDGVTSIGDGAFEYCINLSSITIPSSVTSIGNSAFSGCENLTSIIIPDSVTSMGEQVFSFCKNLTSIKLSPNIERIGYGTFVVCSNLTSIEVPNGIKIICDGAFEHCYSLTSIIIPDSITSIGKAFDYCTSLTSINVSNGNKNYSSVDGVLFNKDKTTLVYYPIGKTNTEYLIPDSVTNIYSYAFENCTKLTSITIPNGVQEIGDCVFIGCISLTSIFIPKSVTSLGSSFSGCTNLTTATISEGVKSISSGLFYGCTKLSSINLPNDITNIGLNAFYNTAYYNNSKNWENNVLYIDNYLIDAKNSIGGTYSVKNGTKTIGDNAFELCGNLTSVTIPYSVININDSAFSDCTKLTNVYYLGSEEDSQKINIHFTNEPLLNATWHYAKASKPATPKVTTTNEISGVQVKWNAVEGATKYNVYRRQGGYKTWTLVGTTTGNTLLDKNVKSGIYYVYSVRAYNSAGQYSDFVSANTQTRKFMATPKLTTIYNHANGLAIKWNAVAGITNGYRVYRRGVGSTYWTYLGTTKNLYFIDLQVKAKSGEYFRYTVIADGGYHSKFDTTGLYLRRLANPTLNSATSSSEGITVKWGKVAGSNGYYVYRKTVNSTWTRVGVVSGVNNLSYLDRTAKKGTTYTYTVRAVYGNTLSSYYSGISCKDKF